MSNTKTQNQSISSTNDVLFETFYQTTRAGGRYLADGGGPFGFDIHIALTVDAIISAYKVDGIVETGTCTGDTTDYLARLYSSIPVVGIELDSVFASSTKRRLRDCPNATVIHGDSGSVLREVLSAFARPLVYLDAHWESKWPLAQELQAINTAIAIVDDYDIKHPRFGFDSYNGHPCDDSLIRKILPNNQIWIPNLRYKHHYPCLQVGRRSGQAYLAIGMSDQQLSQLPMLVVQSQSIGSTEGQR